MAKRYALRDFFRNPERNRFGISPDGKWLSFLGPWEDRLNVYVQPLNDGKPSGEARRVTSEEARDVSSYFWKGSGHVLYQKDFGGDENFHIVSVDINNGKIIDLTPFQGVRASAVDILEDHPTDILVEHNERDPKVFDVYRIDAFSGSSSLIACNPGNILAWLTDHEGRLRVAVSGDGVNLTLLYRDTEADEFKTVLTTNFRDSVSPLFFTFDNKKIYASSNLGRDRKSVVIIDPNSGTEDQIVFEHPEVDIMSMEYSRMRKVPTVVHYITEKFERKYLDIQTARLFAMLEDKLPGYQLDLQANSKDENLWIVAAHNDRTPGIRYLYNITADILTKLCDINPSLAETDMAQMKPVKYVSRDGLTIHGYLTIPAGLPAKNLPVVVNPHGGPWSRDIWHYNGEVQFLANRGYAVLQMNFRGSTGYGRKFWEISFKQWGQSMQDDITDGVQWLIDQGVADPKRIAIYGGSYGGYATLSGITKTPDLYAAAVDYVGVSNLTTFMNTLPPYWEPYRQMMYEMVGDLEKDRDMLRTASPVFQVDCIRTPLFVAQGANDPRVNKAESDQIVEALRKRDVPVKYMVKDNEGHGFHNQENRFEFYAAMEAFLGQHMN